MAGLHQLIPGLKEAEDRYLEQQVEAYMACEASICGIAVKPFTPQMFLELNYAGNACMGQTNTPSVEAVAQFLWRVSEEFSRTDENARRAFHHRIGNTVDYIAARDGIWDYLQGAWAIMPLWPKSNGGGESQGVWPSRIVDMIASEYGWTEDVILNMPFRRLWQYCHRIMERSDRKYNQQSPAAMKLRDNWLNEMNGYPVSGGRN